MLPFSSSRRHAHGILRLNPAPVLYCLEAAINGRVDALVTYNIRDFAVAGERFAVLVLRPPELLKMVKR
jgi:hypothetical protein